jgi:hypothetical protein
MLQGNGERSLGGNGLFPLSERCVAAPPLVKKILDIFYGSGKLKGAAIVHVKKVFFQPKWRWGGRSRRASRIQRGLFNSRAPGYET